MNEELLLSIENAKHRNEHRRLLRNQLSRRQTIVNLTHGITPYVISKPDNLVDCISSSINEPLSSESIYTAFDKYDIDFGPVFTEDVIQNSETDDFYDDQAELDNNLLLLDELFSSRDERSLSEYAGNLLTLHPYTSISINEFCANLINTFRKANLCKSYASDMLKLIHLALPQPNNLPASVNAILKYIRGKLLLHTRLTFLNCFFNSIFCLFSGKFVFQEKSLSIV